ncbi:hypothetical protein BvCmsNSNP016_00582 [Escherichia coli]|nr:hypothetical protein BvCmsNSNP016_00582 [Escherichia coli]
MDKKICVVSMSVGKPASMTAAWINNELIMAERTSYPERRRDMELQLLRELREKEEKGFIVLVEEEKGFEGQWNENVRLWYNLLIIIQYTKVPFQGPFRML